MALRRTSPERSNRFLSTRDRKRYPGGLWKTLSSTRYISKMKKFLQKIFGPRAQERWIETAERVGGQFAPPSGPWYNRGPMTIQVTLEAVEILVDHYTVHTGQAAVTYTRLRAKPPVAKDFTLKIYKSGVLSQLGKSLGFQDIKLGDPDFDRAFVVKSNDESLARSWISPASRSLIAQLRPYTFSLGKGELKALRVGIEKDTFLLESAIRATGELGNSGARILSSWRSAAEVLGGQLSESGVFGHDGALSIHITRGGVPIVIDATRQGAPLLPKEQTYTRVRGRLLTEGVERYEIMRGEAPGASRGMRPVEGASLPDEYRARSEAPGVTRDRLSPVVCSRLGRAAPDAVYSEEEYISLFFVGPQIEVERLRAAVDIAAELCAPHAPGPYR